MSTSEEQAVETAEEVIDTAAELAKETAVHILTRTKIEFAVGGWLLGALTGAFFAYKFAYSRASTKYAQIADAEIADMRRHYTEKGKALEAEAAKGDLESIVVERGYEPTGEEKPPMAIQPPKAVTIDLEEVEEERIEGPDGIKRTPEELRNIFKDAEITHEWDWQEERKNRSPDKPYVVHYDERTEFDYQSVTLTYYAGDNVLCNERDEPIDPEYERDNLIGEGNLDRFGHGSNDANVVYVRNDKLELVFEICYAPGYFAEDVHGFSHSDIESYKNLERMRVRERDESED